MVRLCLPGGHCKYAAAFAAAADKRGHRVLRISSDQVPSRFADFDVLLSTGWGSTRRSLALQAIEAGRLVYVFDLGFFKRDSKDQNSYKQISPNGLANIETRARGPDRWNALELPITTRRADFTSQRVLICAQKFGDNAHGMLREAMAHWIRGRVALIREHTPHTVIVRPHPRSLDYSVRDASILDEWQNPNDTPIEKAIADVDFVVVYNSTVGFECIRQGVPFFCDESADYWPLSAGKMTPENLRSPSVASLARRSEYLWRVAYQQYRMSELENGVAVRSLLEDG